MKSTLKEKNMLMEKQFPLLRREAKLKIAELPSLNVHPFILKLISTVVVVVLLFYVHGKHLRSCRDGN